MVLQLSLTSVLVTSIMISVELATNAVSQPYGPKVATTTDVVSWSYGHKDELAIDLGSFLLYNISV